MSEIQEVRNLALIKMRDYRAKLKVKNKLTTVPTNGYWCWFVKENYEYLSASWKQSIGYEDNELENSPDTWMRLISESGLREALSIFEKHVETKGKYPYYQEVDYKCKDGSVKRFICKGEVTEWSDNGEPLVMIGTHEEVN